MLLPRDFGFSFVLLVLKYSSPFIPLIYSSYESNMRVCNETRFGYSTLLLIATITLLQLFTIKASDYNSFFSFKIQHFLPSYTFVLAVILLQKLIVSFYRLQCSCCASGLNTMSQFFEAILEKSSLLDRKFQILLT